MKRKRRLRNGIISFVLTLTIVIGTFSGIIPGTVTSVKAANTTTVTLDSSNLGNINLNSVTAGQTISSSEIEGITVSITSSGEPIEFYGNPSYNYNLDVNGTGYFTFTSSIGNIKKIVITANSRLYWANANSGWSISGSTFVWSGTPADSVKLSGNGGSNIMGISSIVFTIELPTVTSNVTLNTNGGTINSGNVTTYDEGTGAALPTDITRDGYTFAGWYDNEDLTGNAITEISATDTDDKEYWAKWTPITYTITYENISGATNPNTITSYTIESDTINFANPTKTGYTGSWDITSIPKGSTGNKTITAVWEINKYTIKFVDEDGTEISSKEYDYGTSANDIVKPDAPTKDATAEYTYKFAGWDSELTDVTGNKTYKATYTQTEIKKDHGEKAVSTEVKKDEKSPEVKAANLTNEFAESTLTSEEKADIEDAINNGEDVKVDVYLEIEDISDTISASDKEKIKASVTNADNIEYFDISLFKEISISGRTLGATSVHDLTAPLKLTIGVPKSFPAVADGYTRTYVVLRLHDGSVTVLPTTLNADGTLSFETDKFSTYALAYTDTKKEEVTTEIPTTETPTTEAPTTKVDTPTTEAPKADTPKAPTTGDKINLGVIVMLMIDSAMAGLYLTLRRRLMK